MEYTRENLEGALNHFFGYSQFRMNQLPIIEQVLAGRDVLAIMPTGGGKSICFQLPAMLLPGLTVVISPLIALMKDQVDSLKANGIYAAFLNSTQTPDEQREIIGDIRAGNIKIVYVAPERIPANPQPFIDFLKTLNPSLFAIDEAHCISSWGHDFRPDYLKLAVFKQAFPNIPVLALTASADVTTRNDIVDKLAIRGCQQFISSFNRPNISYFIRPKDNPIFHITNYIIKNRESSGIIYTLSRNSTEEIAGKLLKAGIKAAHYHAGLDPVKRAKVQEAFQKDEVQVIVATIAFGMGIDKSNVRFVIHHDMPKNIEGYYQETGRAGRDGLPSEAILFYSAGDFMKLRNFAQVDGNPEQTSINMSKLKMMQQFCEADTCRRQFLMNYFGEQFPPYCGSCDYCQSELEQTNATIDAQMFLSAVVRTGERYGVGYLIDLLRGSASEKILPEHKQLKTYGVGKHHKKEEWEWIANQLLVHGFIDRTDDKFPQLRLNEKSHAVLRGQTEIMLVKQKPKAPQVTEEMPFDADLLKLLKATRQYYAELEHVPAYNIVSDNTLLEMATYLPSNNSELRMISGFGDYKVEKFGAEFLKDIREHCRRYNLVSKINQKRTKKEVTPSAPKLSDTKTASFKLFKDGYSLAAIAEMRGMSEQTIEGHLTYFITTGEIDIFNLVSLENYEAIKNAVGMLKNPNALKPIKDLVGDNISYSQIKWVLEYLKTER